MFVLGKLWKTNLSRAAFLSGCGMKLLLFLTSDLSLQSVSSKYVISLSFLLISFKSSVSFSAFSVGRVGVKSNPLSNKDISKSLSCLADKFIIFMLFICFFSIESSSARKPRLWL